MSKKTFTLGKFYNCPIIILKKSVYSTIILTLFLFLSTHYSHSQYTLGAINGSTSFDGTGSSNSSSQQTCNCPTGQVVVGIQGKSGSLVDNVTIRCATLNSNGTLGTANTLSSSCQIGSSMGGSGFNFTFSSPTAMVGYTVKTGDELDAITIMGQSVVNIGSGATNSTGATASTTYGGSGGTSYTRWAPNGHVIVGVNFKSGTYGGGMSFNYAPITSCTATAPTSISASSTTICSGSSVTLTAVGGTGSNFQWGTGSTVGSNIISGQTSSTLTVSPTSNTTYWVRRTQSSPCSNTSGVTLTVNVTTPGTAPTGINATSTTVCSGASVTLTATGGSGSNYQWGTGSTVGSNIISGTGVSVTVNPTTTTTYWVRRTNTSPCSNTSGVTRQITVNPVPAQPSSISAPTALCQGTSGTYSVTNVSGVTYTWSYSGTGTISGSGNSISLNPTTGGTLTVTPSNSCGSGTARTYVVSFTSLNSGAHNTAALSMCDGGNPAALSFTTAVSGGSSPYSYQWLLNNSNIASANTNTYDPPALTPGTYSYNCKVTDACGNVAYTSPKVITVTADPDAPSATKSPDVSEVCFGTSLTLNSPTYGTNNGQACGFEYGFSTDNGVTWSTTSGVAPSFQAVSGSTNKIRVRVAGGCATGCNASAWTEYSWIVNSPASSTIHLNGDVIWRGATSTDWATPSNWYFYNGSTYTVASTAPSNTTRTIIPATQGCVSAQPTIAAGTSVNAKDIVIETGATLTMTTGTLNVNGNFTNNGSFVAGTGTVTFNTAGTVSGNATTFNNVNLSNGVNFGSNLSTINGTLSINTGGWVNTNPPIYGLSSLLKYNTGGTYGRWLEWSSTSGAGYPNDVQVSNNTTINYPNTGGTFSTNLGVKRDLIIDVGSNLYMDYGTLNASGSLTVGRDVIAAGDLSLGNQVGGDIYLGGNWTRTTGNFYPNSRTVNFIGNAATQTISGTGALNFVHVTIDKTAGDVNMNNDISISGNLTFQNGNLVLNGKTLNYSGGYNITTNNGGIVGSTSLSKLNFTSSSQITSNLMVTDIYDLTIGDNANVSSAGEYTILNNLTVGNGAIFNKEDGPTLTFKGNIINNGTITDGTSSVLGGSFKFDNTIAQSIGGGQPVSVANLDVNKAFGILDVSVPVTVTGTLTMANGNIVNPSSVITLGSSSADPGTLVHTSGTITGALRRYFDASATAGSGYYFPVGNNLHTRGSTIDFASSPGTDQYLTVRYKPGTAMGATPLYNGLPLTTGDGILIENYEDEGFWEINPTADDYTTSINSTPYTITLQMKNLTTVYDRSTVRIIKAAGSNNVSQHHASWISLNFGANPVIGSSNSDFTVTGTSTGFSWFGAGSGNNNPLPVELVSFSGVCDNGLINLTWQTASEFNSSHFDVEKSRDGENWQVLTTVPSAGTSNELITYQTADHTATDGNNYYRLRQVDNDGKEKLYDPINVSCAEVSPGYFSSFPNPSGTSFQVIVNNKELVGNCTMNIVDATGKVIEQRQIEVKDGINMFVINQEMTPGIYFLNISNGLKTTTVLRHAIK